MMRARVRKAFTLVEILIVVVILGILAAIVIPQFTNASEEAQSSSAASQLSTVRNQIELFRVRNNGTAPAIADIFVEEVAGDEPWDGVVNPDYLRAAPVNPRTGTSTLAAGTAAPTSSVAAGDDGWIYDAATGSIWMNGFDEVNQEWIP
ncbi:MAG: prepilin-type N-terminal cleavage/methylation domain-containing protein [Planctomycetota bacterium]